MRSDETAKSTAEGEVEEEDEAAATLSPLRRPPPSASGKSAAEG